MGAAIRAGESVRAELVNYSKDGKPYLIDIEINPLHSIAGELTGFMAIETDVSERRLAERRTAEGDRVGNRCV